MRTRTITAAAAGLALTGVAADVYGIVATIDRFQRAGLFMIFASVAVAVAGQAQRAATVSEDRLAAAHLAGYRQGIEHAALGLLDPPPAAGGGPGRTAQDTSSPTTYARGPLRMHIVSRLEPPERHAE